MADVIDELKVEVEAATQSADNKLDKFINRMMKVQTIVTGLENIQLSSFTDQLGKLSSAFEKLCSVNVKQSMKGVETQVNQSCKQIGQDLAEAFGIKDKGAIKELDALTKELAQLTSTGDTGKPLDQNLENMVNAIRNGILSTRDWSDEMIRFYNTVRSVEKIKIPYEDKAALGDDWTYMDGMLRQKMSTQDGTSLDTLMTEWRSQFKSIFSDELDKAFNLDTIHGQFQALNQVIKQCREGMVVTDPNSISNDDIWDEVTAKVGRLLSEVSRLKQETSSVAGTTSAGFDTSGLEKIIKSISKVGTDAGAIGIDNLTKMSNSLVALINNLNSAGAIQFDPDGIVALATNVAKLGNTSVTQATENLEKLKTSVSDFIVNMNANSNLTFDTGNIEKVISSITRLGGKNAEQAIKNLPLISSQFNLFIQEMSKYSGIQIDFDGVARMMNAITRIGGKSGTQATKNLEPIKKQILRFVSGLNGIGGLNFDTTNLTNLVSSITKLGGKGATNAIPNIKQLGKAINNLMAQLSKAPAVSQNLINMTNALANLTSNGKKVGTTANLASRGFGSYSAGAKKATKHSFSLAAAIGKVYATYWMVFRAIGMFRKAIDISANLTEVQNVVDVSFGNMSHMVEEFTNTSVQKFGMSELAGKKMAGTFMAMGRSLGGSQTEMANMSVELTKLAADMASFFNVSQEDVGDDLRSVFTGMVRPLRDYGIDLTQANLQQFALAQGIKKPVAAMSQLEKVQLRYNYVMQQTAHIQGDYERTSMSWSNQVRLLGQQFQQLGGIVGGTLINAFKPFLTAMNQVIAKVISVAQAISSALGQIFGWTYEASGQGAGMTGITSDIEDSTDAMDDFGSSTGSAADEAERLAGNLQAFDHLNVISTQKDSSGGGSGSGVSGGTDGTGNYGEWVKGESLLEKYKSEIDSLYELGEYVGNTLAGAMQSIDWNKVYQEARGFGTGLAEFLNGLISPELFGSTGKWIAGCLNTALHALDSFGVEFDWKDFGKSIADGINRFFKKFDFALLAHTFNTWAVGVLDSMIEAISNTRWDRIGRKIGEFVAGINYAEIGSKIGILIWKAINAGIQLWTGTFSAIPIETTIVSVLAALKISAITITGIDKAKDVITAIGKGLNSLANLAVAHPIAAIGAALAALGLGLYNMNKNWKKETAEQFVEFQERIGSNVDNLNASADALLELEKISHETISAATTCVEKIDDLTKSYFHLADQSELTATEQDELKKLANELTDQCPILENAIDKVTGKYTTQRSEIEKLLTAQKEYKKAQAYNEVIGQYENAQQNAAIQLEISESSYAYNEQKIHDLNNAMEDLVASLMDENAWAEQNKATLDALGISYEEGAFDASILSKEISFYTKENEELEKSQSVLEDELRKTSEQLAIAKECYEEHSNAATEAQESTTTFKQALRNLQTDLSNLNLNLADSFVNGLVNGGYDSSALTSFFDSLKEDIAADGESIRQIFEEVGLSIPESFVNALNSQDANAQASAISILLSVGSGVELQKPELTRLFSNLGWEVSDALITGMDGQESATQLKTIELLGMLESGYSLEKGNLILLFENLGQEIPTALINSLDGQDANVQATAIDLICQIPNATEAERDQIIQKLKDFGIDGTEGLISGIDSKLEGADSVATISQKMVDTVKSAPAKEFSSTDSGDMYDYGANASKGFWQGLKDWWDDSWLGRKIDELKGIITGKDGLDEHSPSKIMEKYGAFAGIGFNNSFQDEMDNTIPMVKQWMSGIKNTFDGYEIAFPGIDTSYSFAEPSIDGFSKDAKLAISDVSVSSMDYTSEINSSLKNSNTELLRELKRNNELLEKLVDKPIIDKGDVVDAWKAGAKTYRKQTGKQLGVAY